MPREDRRIIFTFDETYRAIYALCVQKEIRKPPPGMIEKVAIDGEDEKTINVKIHNMQDDSAGTVKYSRDFLAAALMLYCRAHNVPIPKRANKSVEFREDSVILRMTI